MTNKQHLILPSEELVQQWISQWASGGTTLALYIAAQAAQWGADQELEAIFEMVGQQSLPKEDRYLDGLTVASIRATRRPKPPSLKEQALAELDRLIALIPAEGAMAMAEPIRRALEEL